MPVRRVLALAWLITRHVGYLVARRDDAGTGQAILLDFGRRLTDADYRP
ncbi:MAG: hypothetical protein HY703_10670 [Gemmatimonadetes bacterium]|nr:hypothetical protein [Gemmatimonadota bacterium]